MYNTKKIALANEDSPKGLLHIAIFIYWAVLVIWQNIGEYNARSSIDTFIKIGLLAWLAFWYFYSMKNAKMNVVRLSLFMFFVISQLLTLFFEKSLGFSTLVSYIFPSMLLFLSFVYGSNYKISRKQYKNFLNCVIILVAYAAIYAILFKTSQFTSALSISSAYGNELSSFFVSNHEYGMYLVGGIVACIVCLEFVREVSFIKKIPYLLALILFIPNLVLTFSRTAMLALSVFILLYVMLQRKSKQKIIIIALLLLTVIVFATSGGLREFVLKIVLKENNDAGRGELYALAIRYFNDGTLWQQLFGRGIETSREYFVNSTDHGSIHNAYLQVLVYYGAVGFLFMIGFIFSRFVAAVKLINKDCFIGVLSLGLVALCTTLMFTNTTILFNSPVDSFFLTSFTIILPKYFANGLETNEGQK